MMKQHKMNEELGRDLGITGRYKDMPAFEIVDEANDKFLSLTSRLIGLEYGPLGDVLKRQPQWLVLQSRKVRVLDRLCHMRADAVEASHICEEITSIDQAVDVVVTNATIGGR